MAAGRFEVTIMESRNWRVRLTKRMAMAGEDGHSITGWLGELREGDQAAAQPLWERYFAKLVVVARSKLKRLRRTGADEDEEDAALARSTASATGRREASSLN